MKVLLGVCGGIAAYKAAEIVRTLQNRGTAVEVAMTASAEKFVTALTFNALTGKRVHTGLWAADPSAHAAGPIEHIAVAQSIDVLLIAPATATTLARLAHGIADDFLSAVYLATRVPVVLAPAMNANMWKHPATQQNVKLLQARGARVVAPEEGYLACGMTGGGRLADVESIVTATFAVAQPQRDMAGQTVLVTAGGTREPIDPVRFLGNRSSGRMGHALAEAAQARGARVILVSASSLPEPPGCEILRVDTAEEMGAAVKAHLPDATVVLGAAAVADFRYTSPRREKISRSAPLQLALTPTEDLIAYAAAHRRPGALVVAFAAETGELERKGREKLNRKGVDGVVANNVLEPGLGFSSEHNAGLFVTANEALVLPPQTKRSMADAILDGVLSLSRRSSPELRTLQN